LGIEAVNAPALSVLILRMLDHPRVPRRSMIAGTDIPQGL
jgi:hypothetical protein